MFLGFCVGSKLTNTCVTVVRDNWCDPNAVPQPQREQFAFTSTTINIQISASHMKASLSQMYKLGGKESILESMQHVVYRNIMPGATNAAEAIVDLVKELCVTLSCSNDSRLVAAVPHSSPCGSRLGLTSRT